MTRDRRLPAAAGAQTGPSEQPLDAFVRGLLSGALVGAVIAGSAIWQRRRHRGTFVIVGAAKADRSGGADPGAGSGASDASEAGSGP